VIDATQPAQSISWTKKLSGAAAAMIKLVTPLIT